MKKSAFCHCIALILLSVEASGQKKIWDHDSSYYEAYRNRLTARGYFSRKYTDLFLGPPTDLPGLDYKPNTTLNAGVGATYRGLTINIGVGLNSFNPGAEKGKTHYLDLQSHFYGRKWNFDFLGEFYRGFFLSPKGLGSSDGSSYYIRNDLSVQYGGVAVYRALNDRHFSYPAGLLQNEWQKKSAGSFLIGAETYYGAVFGDSAFAPSQVDSSFKEKAIRKMHFFEIGPGVGYGCTLVFVEHYFILASLVVNLDLRYSREFGARQEPYVFDISPNFIIHAGAGYNSRTWGLSLVWVDDQIHIRGNASDYRYRITTGNYRLIYALRFGLSRKLQRRLDAMIPE